MIDHLPVAQDIRQSYNPDPAYAIDANPLLQQKPSKHCRSLFATFLLFAGLATLLALYF